MILHIDMDHSEDLDNERCTKLTFIQNLLCVSVNSELCAIAFVAYSTGNGAGHSTNGIIHWILHILVYSPEARGRVIAQTGDQWVNIRFFFFSFK